MILAFTLSMLGRGSWNGGWSGEDRLYCIVENFKGAKSIALAILALAAAPYYYNWHDGWGARIDVREVTPADARKLRKKSNGFCGYDWMVRTIIDHGRPMADHELREYLAKQEQPA